MAEKQFVYFVERRTFNSALIIEARAVVTKNGNSFHVGKVEGYNILGEWISEFFCLTRSEAYVEASAMMTSKEMSFYFREFGSKYETRIKEIDTWIETGKE